MRKGAKKAHKHNWQLAKYSMQWFEDVVEDYSVWLCECGTIKKHSYGTPPTKDKRSE